MTQIHATGTHESHHRAERATVLARVTIASTDRARSISDATALHNWIAARAQQLRDSGDATWHSADAPNVVIMSVVIDPAKQGKGYSTLLMREFVRGMKALEKKTIHLMCKEHHVGLYERMGYRYVQPSPSNHGGMSWHEMVMEL